MDFGLSEEDELLRDTVRGLCDQSVRPHAGAWDEARALPAEVLTELGGLGLLALEVPETLGGAGLSTVTSTVLLEEIAAADGALALLVSAHNHLGLAHVAGIGLPEAAGLAPPERSAVLPDVLERAQLVAWALSERASGSDALAMVTRARLDGDDLVIDGDKHYILGAAIAPRMVVFARLRDDAAQAGKAGAGRRDPVIAVLVDTDAPGLTVSEPVRTLGMRAAGTAHVQLQGVRVPRSRQLGLGRDDGGDAWRDAVALLDRSRIGVAAIACGITRAALQVATAYAKERQQFGRPIASFQAIQWKLADMATGLDAAWLLTLQAAWRRDAGLPFATHASRAKLLAAGVATRACSEALQIHGGYGYTREFPVERQLRDARACEIAEGTAEIQRLLVSRALVERFAA